MQKKYFHNLVGYQIYPKSFKDSNADGIGDLRGIMEKIPYLKDLGIDFIWINPIYKSPQVDGGYDISDFYDIDGMFGNLDDFKKLIDLAHANGIKLITDLVVNHTSNQHPWFLESKKSKDNYYRDYYHWQDAKPDELPNDWQSFFGESTWTYDPSTEQAYFHAFASEQPDLNWRNEKVREEIYKMVEWWLKLGIDGFRLDAISHIQKDDWDVKIKTYEGNGPFEPFMNVAGIEEYMSCLKSIFDKYGAFTVGEASGVPSYKASDWTNEDTGYLDMIFELDHTCQAEFGKSDIKAYKDIIIRWQEDQLADGWNALYIENHDTTRSIDFFGDGSVKSAKALALHYMFLRGTPFIYQGQEIGMTNFPFKSIKEINDIDSRGLYYRLITDGKTEEEALDEVSKLSRDNSRTPMQWTDEYQAGFSLGQPWMAVNPNYKTINVQEEETETDSLLNFYKKIIKLRQDMDVLSFGDIKFFDKDNPSVFAYARKYHEKEILVIVNLSNHQEKLALDYNLDNFKEIYLEDNQEAVLKNEMKLAAWEYHLFER